jgi:hypothetical protein
MNAGRVVSYIASAIFIFFGILFVWGAFSSQGDPGWIIIGVISVLAGFGLIWLGSRMKSESVASQNTTLKIDLPGDVNLSSLKCQSCGGVLKAENISMIAGAPVVSCPYCKTTYQLTEEPKW